MRLAAGAAGLRPEREHERAPERPLYQLAGRQRRLGLAWQPLTQRERWQLPQSDRLGVAAQGRKEGPAGQESGGLP